MLSCWVKAFQKSSHCTYDVSGLLVLLYYSANDWERWQGKAMVSSAILDQILQQWEPVLFPSVWHRAAAVFPMCNILWKGVNNWRRMQPMCVLFVQLSHSLDVAVYLVEAGGFFHAFFSIKHLRNKINIFSCSSIFFFLSTWFLVESHCLISHVWSDLFFCFFLNEITANSLFIESRHRDPVVESQEVTFFEHLLKSSD